MVLGASNMFSERAATYRERAHQCGNAAETALEEDMRAHWRSAEANWLRLADQLDRVVGELQSFNLLAKDP